MSIVAPLLHVLEKETLALETITLARILVPEDVFQLTELAVLLDSFVTSTKLVSKTHMKPHVPKILTAFHQMN
jgi:hypothetical protein